MTPTGPDRRTFFGGISALFVGLFLHKKVAASAPNPPPHATAAVPTSPSLDETAGNTSTMSYSSSDNLVERPAGRGDYDGITYTFTGEGYEQAT